MLLYHASPCSYEVYFVSLRYIPDCTLGENNIADDRQCRTRVEGTNLCRLLLRQSTVHSQKAKTWEAYQAPKLRRRLRDSQSVLLRNNLLIESALAWFVPTDFAILAKWGRWKLQRSRSSVPSVAGTVQSGLEQLGSMLYCVARQPGKPGTLQRTGLAAQPLVDVVWARAAPSSERVRSWQESA